MKLMLGQIMQVIAYSDRVELVPQKNSTLNLNYSSLNKKRGQKIPQIVILLVVKVS